MAGILEKITKDGSKTQKKESAAKTIRTRKAHKILLGIVDTEKSILEGKLRKYSFLVYGHSNKAEIAKAVQEYYGATVEKVNVLGYKGKFKRFGSHIGQRSDYKKAVVTLKEGQSINL